MEENRYGIERIDTWYNDDNPTYQYNNIILMYGVINRNLFGIKISVKSWRSINME